MDQSGEQQVFDDEEPGDPIDEENQYSSSEAEESTDSEAAKEIADGFIVDENEEEEEDFVVYDDGEDFIEGERHAPTLFEEVFHDLEDRYTFAFEKIVNYFLLFFLPFC